MTLVSEIIHAAYRESNIVAVGASIIPAQEAEALSLLRTLAQSVFGSEIGENLRNFPLGVLNRETPWTGPLDIFVYQNPSINSRLVAVNEVPRDVNFPMYPSPGSFMAIVDPFGHLSTAPVTLRGNGYAIDGQSEVVMSTNGANITWVFRDDLAQWLTIDGFTQSSVFPFPPSYDDYFKIALAMRLNPRYGATLDPQAQVRFAEQKQELRNRYLQIAALIKDPALTLMSKQSYSTLSNEVSGDTNYFNQGNQWPYGWWGGPF